MVKLVEFTNFNQEGKLDYDVVEDVAFFMRNDPIFYRKTFFPAVSKMADMHICGQAVNERDCLGEMCERALESYCKKYKIASVPDEVFTDEDRNNLMHKIFSEEMEQIKRGEYK